MSPHSPTRRAIPRRGFTLLESLMAAGILFLVVVAVTAAVTAGQHHAYTAHQTITGALAAEELLTRLSTVPYDGLATWNGYDEPPGTMTEADGTPMPGSFKGVGREVLVTTSLQVMAGLGVQVLGRTVSVRAYDGDNQTLVTLRRFVPQPAAASLPQEEDEGNIVNELEGTVEDVVEAAGKVVNQAVSGLGGKLK